MGEEKRRWRSLGKFKVMKEKQRKKLRRKNEDLEEKKMEVDMKDVDYGDGKCGRKYNRIGGIERSLC